VDLARKRISLTMKLDAKVPARGEAAGNSFRPAQRNERSSGGSARAAAPASSAMADAFAKLRR